MTPENKQEIYEQIESLEDFLYLNPMTQYQLAKLLGVSEVTVSTWSKKTRNITTTTIKHLNRLHVILKMKLEKIPATGKNL